MGRRQRVREENGYNMFGPIRVGTESPNCCSSLTASCVSIYSFSQNMKRSIKVDEPTQPKQTHEAMLPIK
jgi:hypothetical protein